MYFSKVMCQFLLVYLGIYVSKISRHKLLYFNKCLLKYSSICLGPVFVGTPCSMSKFLTNNGFHCVRFSLLGISQETMVVKGI